MPSVSVIGKSAVSMVACWEFVQLSISPDAGTVYLGSNHRLRAVLQRALEGRGMLKIGVVGKDQDDLIVFSVPQLFSTFSSGLLVLAVENSLPSEML